VGQIDPPLEELFDRPSGTTTSGGFMQPEMSPLIPVDQAVIHFAGHDFLIVRFSDGRVAVVFSHLCEALDLDRWGQTKRIQASSTLSKNFLLVRIKTPGGPQVVNALVTSVLSLWLGGFRMGRLSEEKRALIRLLQTDAADAFNSHFYTVDTQARQQQQAEAPSHVQQSVPQQIATPLSVPEMVRALADRIEQDELKKARQHAEDVAKQAEMQHQLQLQQGEIAVLWSVLLSRASAGEGALSADHHQTLELLMDQDHRVTGQPLAAIRRELLKMVGAAGLDHLQETDWKQIVAWFRQRMGR
jgi:hypothetical protein